MNFTKFRGGALIVEWADASLVRMLARLFPSVIPFVAACPRRFVT